MRLSTGHKTPFQQRQKELAFKQSKQHPDELREQQERLVHFDCGVNEQVASESYSLQPAGSDPPIIEVSTDYNPHAP